jgi:hypothetical protein
MLQSSMPDKGALAHDAIHLVVESYLGYQTGFWGRVCRGAMPREVSALAKSGGHPSSTRARKPDAAIVELIQAERLVECFEAELQAHSETDIGTFQCVLGAACAQSKVPQPVLAAVQIETLRRRLTRLAGTWQEAAIGEGITLAWG